MVSENILLALLESTARHGKASTHFETVDRISSAVLRGVSYEGRLIGRDACNREQEGNRDTRVI